MRIVLRYCTLGDQPTCISCKTSFERDAKGAKNASVFMKAALFGFGAAVAGAILYYGVLKLLDLEIGLVAIAIGYMVGYAMKKARRRDALAVILSEAKERVLPSLRSG